jgi:F-type H+-transporting ATPase subunit delta
VTNKTAANRYARALFDVALQEKADLQGVQRDLAMFAELVATYPELEKVLLNPAVPVTRKRALVVDLTGRLGTSPIVSKLLALLAERDRLILLPDVDVSYSEKLMSHNKIVRAEVTTASPLAPGKAQAIEQRLAKLTGSAVSLGSKVDPSIIGGLVARVGWTVYDASVTGQLQRMKERLTES